MPSGAQCLAVVCIIIHRRIDHRGQFSTPRQPWPAHAAGAALGQSPCCPFYAIRWMGAGDVSSSRYWG
jgi:Flp pilus assembly protein protease CpaA